MMKGLSLLATFGFGGIFLTISPELRDLTAGALTAGLGSLDKYSPWSYVACAAVGLVSFLVMVNTGSRPR